MAFPAHALRWVRHAAGYEDGADSMYRFLIAGMGAEQADIVRRFCDDSLALFSGLRRRAFRPSGATPPLWGTTDCRSRACSRRVPALPTSLTTGRTMPAAQVRARAPFSAASPDGPPWEIADTQSS